MSRRKAPSIPNDILDQLLAGTDAAAALSQGGLLDSLKKAFAERALNAEMDHHLGHDDQVGNNRNGYGRKPRSVSAASKRVKSLSIAPAFTRRSRNSHTVVASGTVPSGRDPGSRQAQFHICPCGFQQSLDRPAGAHS
jgi:hypothetical protein